MCYSTGGLYDKLTGRSFWISSTVEWQSRSISNDLQNSCWQNNDGWLDDVGNCWFTEGLGGPVTLVKNTLRICHSWSGKKTMEAERYKQFGKNTVKKKNTKTKTFRADISINLLDLYSNTWPWYQRDGIRPKTVSAPDVFNPVVKTKKKKRKTHLKVAIVHAGRRKTVSHYFHYYDQFAESAVRKPKIKTPTRNTRSRQGERQHWRRRANCKSATTTARRPRESRQTDTTTVMQW